MNIAILSTCSINRLLYGYNIVYIKNKKKMRNFKLLSVLLLCMAVIFTSCGTWNNTAKGTAIGVGGGAAVGAGVGALAGNTALGSIIGAAVGGTAGALIGKKMDNH